MSLKDHPQNTSILFEAVIEGRVAIKKNGKRLSFRYGRAQLLSSDRYRNWESIAAPDLIKAARRYEALPIKGYIHAEFTFHFKNHQHEPDTSNCIEGPQDLMAKLQIIENDKQIVSLSAKKVFDGTERWSVKLWRAEETP